MWLERRRALTSLFSPDPAHISCLLPPGLLDSCPVDSPITPRAIVTHCHITLTSSLLRFTADAACHTCFGAGWGGGTLARVVFGRPGSQSNHRSSAAPATSCELMCCDKHIQIFSCRNKRLCIVSIKSKLVSGCLPQPLLLPSRNPL